MSDNYTPVQDPTDSKDELIFLNDTTPDDRTTSPDSESEDPRSGAINDDGSINWDCPCLGGMSKGPCGENFKAAFSCFVYSEAEPKGVDCVENFIAMQNCFRQFPDVYGDEIDEEDEEKKGGGESGEEKEGAEKGGKKESTEEGEKKESSEDVKEENVTRIE